MEKIINIEGMKDSIFILLVILKMSWFKEISWCLLIRIKNLLIWTYWMEN